MARAKSPNRERAFEIYREHDGNISSQEIADLLGEKVNNINTWRVKDKWKDYKRGGAPKGNKNAVGNNGGAPEKNQNSKIHGFYSKYYPTKIRNIIKETEDSGGSLLDIQWAQIMTQWANIINSQKIMYVKNQKDLTKELKRTKVQKDNLGSAKNPDIQEVYREEEYELQFAWDKQAALLKAQSQAMGRLQSLIKQYDEMLHKNWDEATEEQKLRVEKLKVQVENEKKGIGSNSLVIFKGEDSLED